MSSPARCRGEAAIWQGVNLPAEFTPMMVLGNNVLQRAGSAQPELRDLVVPTSSATPPR
jgi:hypothetical protein